jgi:hypothetical protein
VLAIRDSSRRERCESKGERKSYIMLRFLHLSPCSSPPSQNPSSPPQQPISRYLGSLFADTSPLTSLISMKVS